MSNSRCSPVRQTHHAHTDYEDVFPFHPQRIIKGLVFHHPLQEEKAVVFGVVIAHQRPQDAGVRARAALKAPLR